MKFVRIVHPDWPMYVDGDEHDDAEYALTRAEWEADLSERSARIRLGGG